MWVARDKDGRLQLFEGHPIKEVEKGEWNYYSIFSDFRPEWEHDFSVKLLNRELFPELTWDDEPIEVELEVVPQPIKPDEYFDEGDMIELESMGIGYRTEEGFIYY